MMSSPTGAEEPLRVLILRLSALGDVVHALESLRSWRGTLPNHHITLGVSEPLAVLAEGVEELDGVLVVPRRWSWKGWLAFRREHRHCNFDLVVDAQGLFKSWLCAKALRHRRYVTWGKPLSRDVLVPHLASEVVREAPVNSRHSTAHLVDRALGGVGLVHRPDPFPCGPVKRVVCAIGAGWPTKVLQGDPWGRLLEAIAKDLPGVPIYFLEGKGEEAQQLQEWSAHWPSGVERWPPMDLATLKGELGPGDLFVGMDSGPTHLARYCGARTFTFYGPSMPEAYDGMGAGSHAPRGVCHLGVTFSTRCDQLRKCQSCSALESIDVVSSWKTFAEEHLDQR